MENQKTVLLLILSSLLLSGCASSPPAQQRVLGQLHREVSKLNQQMGQLTQQASVLERQTLLNQNSTQGAWLIPLANTPVALKSDAGTLRLSLSHVAMEANGTRAILHLRATDSANVPAMTAKVEWGPLDAVTGKPLAAESLSQDVAIPATLLPRSEAQVSLRLSGFSPEQLGYVRVHQLVVTRPAPQTDAVSP